MGLAATAFRIATLTEPHEQADTCWDELGHVYAYIIDDSFHRSARGLTLNRCYEVEERAATVHDSYGGHGRFRELLAITFYGTAPQTTWAAPHHYESEPFFELIQFADNEGTIGPEAAADLAADFAAGRERWLREVDDQWSREKYDEWAAAFGAAADGGLVRFA